VITAVFFKDYDSFAYLEPLQKIIEIGRYPYSYPRLVFPWMYNASIRND